MPRKPAQRPPADPAAIAARAERAIPRGASPERALEDLARRFFLALEPGRAAAGASGARRLAGAFAEAGEKRGIEPGEFYGAVIERALGDAAEAEPRGAGRSGAKERILEAALDVFSEKGFHLATVDEIAERAGLGKGTVYRHFENKEALFRDLVKIRLGELERDVAADLDREDDVLVMIGKYVRIYFEFFDRNKGLYRLIVRERPEVGETVRDMYVRKILRRIPVLKLKIREAADSGVFRDVDFQTVFYGVMGFIHGVIEKWLDDDCASPLADEAPLVTEVLFHGFVREPATGGSHDGG